MLPISLGDELDRMIPVFLLGMIAFATFLWLVLFSHPGVRKQLRRRQARLDEKQRALAAAETAAAAPRTERRSGDDPTRRLAGTFADSQVLQNKARLTPARFTPRALLLQAGFGDRAPAYVLGAIGVAALITVLLIAAGARPMGAMMLGSVAGVGAPFVYVLRKRARRLRIIEAEFPSAIEIIVRGLRAGLPLTDCLRLVADEADPAVAREFRRVVDDTGIGVPLLLAMDRLAERVPVAEVQLFAIVIGLHSGAGGSVAGSLETLARTLRSRRALRDKVDIMSQEARSSAAIIGSLPVIVALVLFFVSPDYVGMLFNTTTGLWVLLGSALWMAAGVQVMRSMINFDA